jgi:hypothetical protein
LDALCVSNVVLNPVVVQDVAHLFLLTLGHRLVVKIWMLTSFDCKGQALSEAGLQDAGDLLYDVLHLAD